MAIIRHILLCTIALGISTMLHAQLPSRAEIDKVVNPSLSTVAKRAVRAERSVVEIGTIKQDEQREVSFTLKNTSASTVAITELRSTCSCLRVATKPKALRAGEEIEVVAMFNPAGRNGGFSIPILLYTTLDPKHPTLRLTVEGNVVATDEWSHLAESMGTLRLSRKSVTFDRNTRTERIAVVNVGENPVTLSAKPTAEGITLRTEPELLQPNAEGDIVITYSPTTEPMRDIETAIIVEGCGTARPSERMIKIIIKK